MGVQIRYKVSKSVDISSGGINYRGASIHGDYYRAYPDQFDGKHGITLQAIKNNHAIFMAFLPMAKNKAISLANELRDNISNVYNPHKDIYK